MAKQNSQASQVFEFTFIVGPSGSGKSTWIREELAVHWEQIFNEQKPPCVFVGHDMHNEYGHHLTNDVPTMDWDSLKWNDFLPRTVFALDEMDAICDPSAGKKNTVRRLMNYGRQRGYIILGATRRPHQAHPDCRAMATRLIIFKPGTPEDAEYLSKWLGSDVGARAMALPRYQHLTIRR